LIRSKNKGENEMVVNNYINMTLNGEDYLLSYFSFSNLKGAFYSIANAKSFEEIDCKLGDEAKIKLISGDDKTTIYTGFIDNFILFNGELNLVLKEGNTKFFGGKILSNYREEKAESILSDILSEIEITEKEIDFEDVEIERFNLNFTPPHLALTYLIDTIYHYTNKKIICFFDAKGKFHFVEEKKYIDGTKEVEFNTGENILSAYPGHIETFVSDLRHSNKIKIDDSSFISSGINFNFGSKQKMEVYFEPAESN